MAAAELKQPLRLPLSGPPPSSEPTTDASNTGGALWNGSGYDEGALSDESIQLDPNVWLHVYHCDDYTGFLNRACLSSVDMPIYHVGVEIYEDEWAFQYFEDAWDEFDISGVVRCRPKGMLDFTYQYSMCLGATSLDIRQVEKIIQRMHNEWPACGYHLTRRNCLNFAETLVGFLRPSESFPEVLRWLDKATRSHPNTDVVVDYAWSWAKWRMLKKHSRPEPPVEHRGFLESTCGQCVPTEKEAASVVPTNASAHPPQK